MSGTGFDWFRMDCTIYSHPKVVALARTEHGAAGFMLYVCALAWSVQQGQDGLIPELMLPILHGTEEGVKALLASHLWDEDSPGFYRIHDYGEFQQSVKVRQAIRKAQSEGGRRGAAKRWGKDT